MHSILTGTSSGAFIAAGKDLCRGNQQDNATTPASLSGNINAEYSAKAPPCENPPRSILFDGMPPFISFSIIAWTCLVAFLIPVKTKHLLVEALAKTLLHKLPMIT